MQRCLPEFHNLASVHETATQKTCSGAPTFCFLKYVKKEQLDRKTIQTEKRTGEEHKPWPGEFWFKALRDLYKYLRLFP